MTDHLTFGNVVIPAALFAFVGIYLLIDWLARRRHVEYENGEGDTWQ